MGIHANGWSEQQTLNPVLAGKVSPLTAVRSEVERAVQNWLAKQDS